MISARPMTQKSYSEILMRRSDGEVSLAPLSNSSGSTRTNDMRLIDFGAARNMVVCNTRFQHLDIHKAIEPNRSYCLLDVRTFIGPNIDSDHYLVAAKFRLHISASVTAHSSGLRNLDIRKLRSQGTAEAFSVQLSDRLRRSPSNISDIGGQWANISHSCTTAETVLSFERHPNEINGKMRSVARELRQKMPHTRKRCSQSLREPLSRTIGRREWKRDAFSGERRGSTIGVSVRKARCTDV